MAATKVKACPRCGADVQLGPDSGKIKAHTDPFSRAPCPAVNKTLREAREWVEDARRRLQETFS